MSDLYVGATVTVYSRRLTLTGYADEKTSRAVREKREETFVMVVGRDASRVGRCVAAMQGAGMTIVDVRTVRFESSRAEELETALRNIDNKQLFVSLETEVKYESETGDRLKRLAALCKQVRVETLRLSKGKCAGVIISTNEISMSSVHLHSGEDVTRLHHLVSQYQSWQV